MATHFSNISDAAASLTQKFRSKFLPPQKFIWVFSFFFAKKLFWCRNYGEKIATKTTLLFFGNISPRIASHAFLTIWDTLKCSKMNLSEKKIFRIFHFFQENRHFFKNWFRLHMQARACASYRTHFSNICCCAPPAEISVEISAYQPISTVFFICGSGDFELLLK